jgi:hypothetical protein
MKGDGRRIARVSKPVFANFVNSKQSLKKPPSGEPSGFFFSKLPVFDLASSLCKFPGHYSQHILGIGVPRLGGNFLAL